MKYMEWADGPVTDATPIAFRKCGLNTRAVGALLNADYETMGEVRRLRLTDEFLKLMDQPNVGWKTIHHIEAVIFELFPLPLG